MLMFQCLYDLTDLKMIFHTNILAYYQQNQYMRVTIYTDLFTLKC